MTAALINRKILKWAMKRSHFDPTLLSEKTKYEEDVIRKWLAGDVHPSFPQLKKVANVLHVPFGYFYLDKPPKEEMLIPDCRTVGSGRVEDLSLNFRDLLKDVYLKHDWYLEYLKELGVEKLPFVGKYSENANIKNIAKEIRDKLKIDMFQSDTFGAKFKSELVKRCEDIGIWVMISGIVGNNTHRSLDVKEFRGFAIVDEYAPLIFINGKDFSNAQHFTIIHELAHIWIGESGISNNDIGAKQAGHTRIERICNAVASEVLAPEKELKEIYNKDASFEENVDVLRKHFNVSSLVIGRRLYDLDMAKWKDYQGLYQYFSNKSSKSSKSGGDFYATLRVRNGRSFSEAIVRETKAGNVNYREGSRLLGVTPNQIDRCYKEFGA